MGLFNLIFPARAEQERKEEEGRQLALLKARLGLQKEQQELETGRRSMTPIEVIFGSKQVPNVTAGTPMSGQTVTSAPQQPNLPDGMEGLGKLNLGEIENLAKAKLYLSGTKGAKDLIPKIATLQDQANTGGTIKAGTRTTLGEIDDATALFRAKTMAGLRQEGKDNEFLTPTESQQLDVPYGTSKKDAKGKIPQKVPTDTQQVTATYANRIEQAEEVLNSLSDYAKTVNPLWFTTQRNLPDVANKLKDPRFQQLEQAMSNFINATLRRESGAVINPDEFVKGFKQYFTIPGDADETIEQKRINRDIVKQGFIQGAGAAYKPYKSEFELKDRAKQWLRDNGQNDSDVNVQWAIQNGHVK